MLATLLAGIGKKRSEVTQKPNSIEDNGESLGDGDQRQWNQRSKIAKAKIAGVLIGLNFISLFVSIDNSITPFRYPPVFPLILSSLWS